MIIFSFHALRISLSFSLSFSLSALSLEPSSEEQWLEALTAKLQDMEARSETEVGTGVEQVGKPKVQ